MEARRQPSRKVREEASVRKDVENAEKEANKRSAQEQAQKAVKKLKKAVSEEKAETEIANTKKTAKSSKKAKNGDSPAAQETNGDSKKKASKIKNAGKSKTVEDIDSKQENSENGDSRRSRSAESASTSSKSKKKDSKKEENTEKEPVAVKKGKKAAAENSEKAEVASKNDSRGKRGNQTEEASLDPPPVKKGRGGKKEEQKEEKSEKSPAKTASNGSTKKEDSPKKLQNNVDTNYSNINFGIKEKFNFKITTWNVAGIRALVKKNPDYFNQENADIICMNEIKCGNSKEVPDEYKIEGYHAYWNLGKGAGGVGLLSKVEPLKVTYDLPDSEFSEEKRMITAEFEKFFVVSVYVVNSGRGLKTLDKRMEFNTVFDNYVQELDKKKPVIIAGDMNVSHQEIDLTNPKPNKKNAGFTQEERDGFTKLLSLGFVDTFRHFYPELTGAYTFWSYMNNARLKNVGWRLDYFLVSKRFMKHVKDNVIRSTVMGSDHCPIVLFLDL